MRTLVCAALFAGTATSTFAADIVEPADAPEPSGYVGNWGGFYAGFHGGYGQSDYGGIFDEAGTEPFTSFGTFDVSGGLVGVQAGYNWDLGGLILGVEGDYSFLHLQDSFVDGEDDEQALEANRFYSLRARFGAANERVLAYVTGGIGYAKNRLIVENGDDSLSFSSNGLVYGAGVEYLVAPGITLRTEALRFAGSRNFRSTDNAGSGALDDLSDGDDDDYLSWHGIDMLRVGLNFKLGGAAPIQSAARATVHDFSGFYVTANGGFGTAGAGGMFDTAGSAPFADFAEFDVSGFHGGVGAGYNFQVGSMVYGIEGDFAWAHLQDSFVDGEDDEQALEIDEISSIRGRIGVVSGNLMVYATAGIAFSELDLIVENGDDSISLGHTGIAYGGGVEWAINNRVSIRAEALRYDFNEAIAAGDDGVLDDISDGDEDDSLNFSGIDTVRAAVVFHF